MLILFENKKKKALNCGRENNGKSSIKTTKIKRIKFVHPKFSS